MSSGMVIGRFAPTPSGFMHIGNLMCAMIAYLSAKSKGGKFIIRIEDVDAARCTRESVRDIIETLSALGLASDEPIVYQSSRTDAYAETVDKLKRVAKLYPCFCTRAELHSDSAVQLPDGGVLYSGACKNLTADEVKAKSEKLGYALRLSVPDEMISFTDGIFGEQRQNLARECGDFVIRRRDGVYAYQLAVVVDDAASGVTEVVRGADLLYDTPRQIYLQKLLGFDTPEYYHIPLVVDNDGRKLSKSTGDSAARLLKSKTAEEIIGELAYKANIIDECRPIALKELIPLYDAERIRRAACR